MLNNHFPSRCRIILPRIIRRLQCLLRNRTFLLPISSMLQGGERLIPADQYSRLICKPLRPSIPVASGPHVKFLLEYKKKGTKIFDPGIFERTEYYMNALECIEYTGEYFSARSANQIRNVAKAFIDSFVKRNKIGFPHGHNGHSPIGSSVLVRPIKHSSCYEIVDGNHRIAAAFAKGCNTMRVKSVGVPTLTPAQKALMDVLWQEGRTELYQPINLPEVQNWTLVRHCKDRLNKILLFLKHLELSTNHNYIDLGCSYGWFVLQMLKQGYSALGVERDPFAINIGKMIYGIDLKYFERSSLIKFFKLNNKSFDIVSCFSVLHHFVLHKDVMSPVDLIYYLDKITKKVLFLETGQNHEFWFKNCLSEWSPKFISNWIHKHTTFKTVVNLGPDSDSVGKFSGNFGRSLFACIR